MQKGVIVMANTVITIGRQFGSGGKEIGQKLADRMNIPCYDKELLDKAAKDSGLCKEIFESNDEKHNASFLYSLVMDTYSLGYTSSVYSDMPLNQKVFLAQYDAIKKLAKEGSCVIVGRCADYALENYKGLLSVFIHSDMEKRIQRIMKVRDLNAKKAKELIIKTDKQRSSYYNYYSSKQWGVASSYQICLDSGVLGIEDCVNLLEQAVKIRFGK